MFAFNHKAIQWQLHLAMEKTRPGSCIDHVLYTELLSCPTVCRKHVLLKTADRVGKLPMEFNFFTELIFFTDLLFAIMDTRVYFQ